MTNFCKISDVVKCHFHIEQCHFWGTVYDGSSISKELWPPRSPDMSLSDFVLVHQKAYGHPYGNNAYSIAELKTNIEHEIQLISFSTLRSVGLNVIKHILACNRGTGSHFEISYDNVNFSFSFVSRNNDSFNLIHICDLNHVYIFYNKIFFHELHDFSITLL